MDFKEISEGESIRVHRLNQKYWQIDLMRNKTLTQRYGVNSIGEIYKYEKKCTRSNKTVSRKIKDLVTDVGGMKNQSL